MKVIVSAVIFGASILVFAAKDPTKPSETYPSTHTRETNERPWGPKGSPGFRPLGDLTGHIREEIQRDKTITTPSTEVKVAQVGKFVILRGKVASEAEALRIATIAAKAAPELILKNDLSFPREKVKAPPVPIQRKDMAP